MSHTSMKELYEAEKDWLIERLSWAEQQRDEAIDLLKRLHRDTCYRLHEDDDRFDRPSAALFSEVEALLAKHEGKT